MTKTTANFPSRCNICRKGIAIGDPIYQHSGRWVHVVCQERAKELTQIVSKAQDAHRESKDMGEMQYSVSCSNGSAMEYALRESVVTQEEFDAVKKDPTYRELWNYVSD